MVRKPFHLPPKYWQGEERRRSDRHAQASWIHTLSMPTMFRFALLNSTPILMTASAWP